MNLLAQFCNMHSMTNTTKIMNENWSNYRLSRNKIANPPERKTNGVCLRPHGRSENFTKARFIIHNTTVFLFYIHKVITFTIHI